MIQISWWRRLEEEDDLEDDLNMKKIKKMKNTWRQRRIEYEDAEMIQSIQRRRPVLKIVSKEYLAS